MNPSKFAIYIIFKKNQNKYNFTVFHILHTTNESNEIPQKYFIYHMDNFVEFSHTTNEVKKKKIKNFSTLYMI